MEKQLTKKECLLLVVVFVLILILWACFSFGDAESGAQVRVTVDGEEYGVYSLSKQQTIPITVDGEVTNMLIISDGEADITEADCPDQICVNAASVSALGETIVCLPNRVVVEVIAADEEAAFDAIAR